MKKAAKHFLTIFIVLTVVTRWYREESKASDYG